MNLNINNEYDKLLKVILSPVSNEYLPVHQELINILNKYNIEILLTKENMKAKYQMFTRDPLVVIKDKVLINYMKEDYRHIEIPSYREILDEIPDDKKIYLEKNVILEGGDIIIHNGIIFVGQNGNRTNKDGISFLKETFKDKFKIIPLDMINPSKYIPFVHLDCVFNPVFNDVAIIYEKGFTKESLDIIKSLFPNLIYINDQEQEELATNIVSLGNKVVIVQKRHKRLIEHLINLGFKIETMSKYDTVQETGYIRCLTCPLERQVI